jgi:polysaccharide deacetylase family protein (PEP-CTERM system associated)
MSRVDPARAREEAAAVRATVTLDVEDWEHANYAQLRGNEASIATTVRERRYAMDANTDRWIEILGRAGAVSTCFVLGEFADRYPEAIRRLARAGHEIATPGATHDLVYEMTRERFREFLQRGIGALEKVTGERPLGFRAPTWSVDRGTPWLVEELVAAGLRYDASVFPVRTRLFGDDALPLEVRRSGGLLRIPVTVAEFAGHRVPIASGVFRIMPGALLRYAFAQAGRRGRPLMIVLHPRELDPSHPRLPLRGWARLGHYAGLRATVPKLESLLARWRWGSIRDVYGPDF